MDDITQPIGPPVPQQPGTATPGPTHGPNLPEVAAATPDERARAEALWKASVANAEPWRADGRVLDPTRPETLVYWNGPGDRLALAGVMYTAPRGPADPGSAGRSPGGTTTSPAGTRLPGPGWAGPWTAPAPRARSTGAAAR